MKNEEGESKEKGSRQWVEKKPRRGCRAVVYCLQLTALSCIRLTAYSLKLAA